MKINTYKNLRAVSFLVFVFTFLSFISMLLVCVAPQKGFIQDETGKTVGTAYIPFDRSSIAIPLFFVTVLAGIQFIAIMSIGKEIIKDPNQKPSGNPGPPSS
ncbi:MAG: hypothetical protein A2X48_17720 [Lentisphaerae bacterium GWF2_49_21]|nr:MAG: hypothetical protein A2X48_17720 [Lentisphaerae bacterium GWF2_49_21]